MTGWTACAVHPITPAGTPLTGESAAVTSLRARAPTTSGVGHLGWDLVWQEAAPRRGAEMAAELLPRPRSQRSHRLPKPDRLRKLTRQNGDQSLRRDASELHLPRPSTERVLDRRLSHSHLLCLLARQVAEEAA